MTIPTQPPGVVRTSCRPVGEDDAMWKKNSPVYGTALVAEGRDNVGVAMRKMETNGPVAMTLSEKTP